jgi:LysR family nitrogen assimilation transcriptional regulator
VDVTVIGSLQDIRLFVAAYEERSFTAAGLRENATQSGVSQHIRKLEERFQIGLFVREKGRVTPTPAGDSYYRGCLEVLRAHDAASKMAQAYRGGLDGEVVVGLMPTMTRCVLAPALARFTEAHPNAAIKVVEGYSGTLTTLVQKAELDFAIVPAIAGIAGVKSRLYLRTPEVLVSGRGSRLRRSPSGAIWSRCGRAISAASGWWRRAGSTLAGSASRPISARTEWRSNG